VLQPRFERFRRAHLAWTSANDRVAVAVAVETEKRLAQGEADAEQDELVDHLAMSLVADGFSRIAPFKGFSPLGPALLKRLDALKEAKACLQLAHGVRRAKKASAKSKSIALRLAAASKAVLAFSAPIQRAETEAVARRRNRNALVAEWGKAYRLLKGAAKLERDESGTATFDALFSPRTSRAPKKGR
jgi:hypothetical protein